MQEDSGQATDVKSAAVGGLECLSPEAIARAACGESLLPNEYVHLDACEVCRAWLLAMQSDEESVPNSRVHGSFAESVAGGPRRSCEARTESRTLVMQSSLRSNRIARGTPTGLPVGAGQEAAADAAAAVRDHRAHSLRARGRNARIAAELVVQPGDSVGRYRIVALVGSGAFGTVYQAWDPKLGRHVAIKFVRHDRVLTDALRTRFEREAQAIATVRHPNVVTVFDVGHAEFDGAAYPYLVMEFVESGTTFDTLFAKANGKAAQVGALAPAMLLGVLQQLASAIAAVHDAGITHRDIKPSNVALTRDGAVKLLDFGLAATMTQGSGERAGTLAYMAPEVISGSECTPHSDQYSFAVVAVELLTGVRVRAVDHLKLRGYPRRVTNAIRRAGAANPTRRWASMHEVAASFAVPKRGRWRGVSLGVGLAVAAMGAAWVATAKLTVAPALTERADKFCQEALHQTFRAPACDHLSSAANQTCRTWQSITARFAQRWQRDVGAICVARRLPQTTATGAAVRNTEACVRNVGEYFQNMIRATAAARFAWDSFEPTAMNVPLAKGCVLSPMSFPLPPTAAQTSSVMLIESGLARAWEGGNVDDVAELVAQSRQLGYLPTLARALANYALKQDDWPVARRTLDEAVVQAELANANDVRLAIMSQLITGSLDEGEYVTATSLLRQTLALASSLGAKPDHLSHSRIETLAHTIAPEELEADLVGTPSSTEAFLRSAYGGAAITLAGDYRKAESQLPWLAAHCDQEADSVRLECVSLRSEVADRNGYARQALAVADELMALHVNEVYEPDARTWQYGLDAAFRMNDSVAFAQRLAEGCKRWPAECETWNLAYGIWRGDAGAQARLRAHPEGVAAAELRAHLGLLSGSAAVVRSALSDWPSQPTPKQAYLRSYFTAQWLAMQHRTSEAYQAMTAAIASRRESGASYGVDDFMLDVEFAAELALQLEPKAQRETVARAILDDYRTVAEGVPHIYSQWLLAYVRLGVMPGWWKLADAVDAAGVRGAVGTRRANAWSEVLLQQAAAAISDAQPNDPRYAVRLRKLWRHAAQAAHARRPL